MKKILIASLLGLTLISTAGAHGPYRMGGWHGGYYHGGYGCGGCWVAPALIGGVIGYEIARPQQEVIIEQQPVIVQQPQTVVQTPPIGYHWQEMIDPQTNTRKIVLVPN